MAGSPIRVGVVGLGSFGAHHARHYAANPAASLVAVADIDAERAEATAARFGVPAFSNHRDLIGRVDAASVAVSASRHHEVAADLIGAGIHVLVEKPLAATAGAARDLVQRADRRGVVLQAGHVERYSPAAEALRERVQEPRRISCLRRTVWSGRSADVDVVLDLMIHDIDLVLMLAGAPVASVAASGSSVTSGLTDEAEAWLTFANGLVATLSASRAAERNERKMSITEPAATYTADFAAPSLSVASRSHWGAAAEAIVLPVRDNLGAEIDAFLGSIAEGTTPEVDGRAGLAAVEIAERIQAAIADANAPLRSGGR